MNYISISQLKINPASAIALSNDAPIALNKRDKTQAYLVGKDLFEQMVSYIEDVVDNRVAQETDFSKGRDFEEIAQELGI